VSTLFAEIRRRKVFQTFVPYLGFVWLILQIVSVVTPMFQLSPLFNTLVAVSLFAGMPVMLYLSWYFDFTMDGLVAIPESDSGEVSSFGFSRWAVLSIITLGSGLLAYRYFSTVQIEFAKANDGIQQTFIANSIAVLPFKDASADQDQAFLAQGLAEEITSLLGRSNGLKVAASSSTSILADKGLDPVSIARRLRVDTILTGSVRVTGDQLKIRVELVNASDTKVLWSETFARKFSDIFSVESEIARSTVNMLQDTYIETGSLTNSATTKSTDAYVIYLKGREQYRKQTTESMKEARKLFEQAIGLDPEYAQAYVALADTVALLADGSRNFGILKPEIAKQLAEQHLAKALVRVPEYAEAYAVQGRVFDLGNEQDSALSAFNKAIELNPSLAIAYMWKYLLLMDMGREGEAFSTLKIALSLDPESITIQFNLGTELSRRGDLHEAKNHFNNLVTEYPSSPLGYAGLADIDFQVGKLAMSMMNWHKASQLSPDNTTYKFRVIGILSMLKFDQEVEQLTDDPFYRPQLLINENKLSELFEYMSFQIAANPDDPWIKFEAGWYQLLLGDKSKGIAYMQETHQTLDPNELYAMPYCSPAIEIAWALKQLNKNEESQRLLKECDIKLNQAIKSNIIEKNLTYLAARIAALTNKNEEAIKLLEELYQSGWREWWTEYDPLFSALTDNQRFIKVAQDIRTALNEQRELAKPKLVELSLATKSN
jgi:TolB-like protein/tetratricopeptide (TPR) repeat protein